MGTSLGLFAYRAPNSYACTFSTPLRRNIWVAGLRCILPSFCTMARKMMIDGEVHGSTTQQYDFDLFTIGAGSGGVRASRMSAGLGARVAVCELQFSPISSESLGGIGGTCVLRGCVPKKILVYGASFSGEFEDSRNFGWDIHGEITFDWKRLIENKTKEITRLNGIYKKMLSASGVVVLEGEGRVIDDHIVEVKQTNGEVERYTAKNILISTGSRAVLLNIPGKELAITSDEALSLENFPKRSVIVGGGYIAVEFAGIYNGMGSKVDLFYRKDAPLRGFDDEMRFVVAKNLENRGVRLHPNTNIVKIEKGVNELKVLTDRGDEIAADIVLFAVGRKPNVRRLNLDAVGVELDPQGAIKVNEYSQTSVPSIWAVGDVTNRMNLTPVALMEGSCLAKTLFGGEKAKPDYEYVPSAVFSIPPLSVVGLTEQEAVAQAKNDIVVYTSTFTPMKNTISGRQEKTVMKLIVDSASDKVIGAGMCGPDAPEIIQGIAIAMKCGATKAQFDSTVGLHPSAAEEFVTMRTATRLVSPDGQIRKS